MLLEERIKGGDSLRIDAKEGGIVIDKV